MVSVSTWIARVDFALQGARLSGSGDWTDNELYYVLGNKLQDNAARWWVQMDQEVRGGEKTWTNLKAALVRRYGERPDRSAAEWRVSQRRMIPGETFVDFAAGLRDLCGQNRVSERVSLAQFLPQPGEDDEAAGEAGASAQDTERSCRQGHRNR